jgi:hypothetical protein
MIKRVFFIAFFLHTPIKNAGLGSIFGMSKYFMFCAVGQRTLMGPT